MSLLHELGLDPDEFEWHDLAGCKDTSPVLDKNGVWRDFFFDDYENDEVVAEQADEMCLGCPVMKECGIYAMTTGQVGLWGGVYWNGAGKPDKNKNSHKSDETWARVKKRMTE